MTKFRSWTILVNTRVSIAPGNRSKTWDNRPDLLCQRIANRNKTTKSSRSWLRRHEKDEYARRARETGLPSRAFYKLQQIESIINGKTKNKRIKEDKKSEHCESSPLKHVKIFKKGQTVVDLGAAPGGWSLYASQKIGKNGALLAVDLLPIDEATTSSIRRNTNDQFWFLEGSIVHRPTKEWIFDTLSLSASSTLMTMESLETTGMVRTFFDRILTGRADVVVSDMATNFTGDRTTDALQTMNLCEEAFMLAAGSECFVSENSPSSKGNGNENDDDDDNESFLHEVFVAPLNNKAIDVRERFGVLRKGGSFVCKFFNCGQTNERELREALKLHFDDVHYVKPSASRKDSAEHYAVAMGFKGNRYVAQAEKIMEKLKRSSIQQR